MAVNLGGGVAGTTRNADQHTYRSVLSSSVASHTSSGASSTSMCSFITPCLCDAIWNQSAMTIVVLPVAVRRPATRPGANRCHKALLAGRSSGMSFTGQATLEATFQRAVSGWHGTASCSSDAAHAAAHQVHTGREAPANGA